MTGVLGEGPGSFLRKEGSAFISDELIWRNIIFPQALRQAKSGLLQLTGRQNFFGGSPTRPRSPFVRQPVLDPMQSRRKFPARRSLASLGCSSAESSILSRETDFNFEELWPLSAIDRGENGPVLKPAMIGWQRPLERPGNGIMGLRAFRSGPFGFFQGFPVRRGTHLKFQL